MKTPKHEKNNTGRLIYRIVLIVLLSVFLGGSVYSLNARRVLRNALPMPFGIGTSVVLSGSMEPTLSVNDLVIVQTADTYAVGDVVVYQSGSSLVIHRIVRVEDKYVVTRGDANNTEDDPVALSAVKGRMVFAIPFLGLPVRLLQSTLGTVLVIVLIAALMSMSWRKERAEDDRKLDEIKSEIRRLKELEENKE
ncbi:MAG: signal peptidase I [Bacteroidales bacterium]|nr:signal peptidase I [Bacteroidales bacterium]